MKTLRDKIIKVRWAMVDRCYNPSNQAYPRYGGRGIKVCDEWLNSYDAFYNWAISNGYQEGLTIDRIDNDGNYEPSNCRWVDRFIQANNKSSNHKYLHRGEMLTLREISDKYGYDYDLIRGRVQGEKWTLEKAINTLKKEKHHITINGVTKTLAEWARVYGVAKNTAYNRFDKGLPIMEVLNPEKLKKDDITKRVNKEEYKKSRVEYKGEYYSLKELASKFGITPQCLSYRIKDMGMSIEEAVSYQSRKRFLITLNGETKTLTQWCKERGLKSDTVRHRLELGLTAEEAFDPSLTTVNGRRVRELAKNRVKNSGLCFATKKK